MALTAQTNRASMLFEILLVYNEWCLMHCLIILQLHTYVYIVPPPLHVGEAAPRSPSSLSSGRGSELTVDGVNRVSRSAGSGIKVLLTLGACARGTVVVLCVCVSVCVCVCVCVCLLLR